jgi:MFS family permease
MMKKHPLFITLADLRGNVRACVYTEPLWGIPFNLYAPYTSVYMLALGLFDRQIGLIASISLVGQFFNALLSGAITDKFGRKRTTYLSDIISWSIPCLIWALAQDFRYFLVAAIINSVWRVSMTSWSCLLVEDTEPRLLVDVYSWIYISGYIAAFLAPITMVLIDQFTLVPTMRALYLFAFALMTLKFVLMNNMVTETRQGIIRMEETRNQPMVSLLREYRGVLRQILDTPVTIFTLGLMVIMSINMTVSSTFWSILVTQELLVPEQFLSVFAALKSLVMMIFLFLVNTRIREMDSRKPLAIGFILFIFAQLLIITMTPGATLLLVLAVVLEACALPMTGTLLDKLVVVSIDPKERARIMSILYVTVIAFTSPFGWIAGRLSEINRKLPFMMSISLFALAVLLLFISTRVPRLYAGDNQHNADIQNEEVESNSSLSIK